MSIDWNNLEPIERETWRVKRLELNVKELEKISRLIVSIIARHELLLKMEPDDAQSSAQREFVLDALGRLVVVKDNAVECLAFARSFLEARKNASNGDGPL
jgi:hypothetical protein